MVGVGVGAEIEAIFRVGARVGAVVEVGVGAEIEARFRDLEIGLGLG